MYVVYADADGPWNCGSGRVYKLDTSTGTWTNVTPSNNNYSYGGVSVDPSNANRVVVSTINKYNNNQYGTTWGDFVYLSTDGGTSWTLKNGSNSTFNKNGIGWTNGQLHWAGSIEFTPGKSAEVRVVSGNGIFTCSMDASKPSWKLDVKGLEETGVTGGVSIPGGPFISVFGDITGFVHNDLTTYPAQTHQPADGSNWSVDYAGASINNVVGNGDEQYIKIVHGFERAEIALVRQTSCRNMALLKKTMGLNAVVKLHFWFKIKTALNFNMPFVLRIDGDVGDVEGPGFRNGLDQLVV
jgi:hypothetical protein